MIKLRKRGWWPPISILPMDIPMDIPMDTTRYLRRLLSNMQQQVVDIIMTTCHAQTPTANMIIWVECGWVAHLQKKSWCETKTHPTKMDRIIEWRSCTYVCIPTFLTVDGWNTSETNDLLLACLWSYRYYYYTQTFVWCRKHASNY